MPDAITAETKGIMRTKLGKSLGVVIKMEEVMQDTDDECTLEESAGSLRRKFPVEEGKDAREAYQAYKRLKRASSSSHM